MHIKNPREANGILEDWRKSESVRLMRSGDCQKRIGSVREYFSSRCKSISGAASKDGLLNVVIKACGLISIGPLISGKEKAAPASNDQWVLRIVILIAPTSRNKNDDRTGCDVLKLTTVIFVLRNRYCMIIIGIST